MKTEIKYQLTATKCTDYSLDYGWQTADRTEQESEYFDTEDEALNAKNDFVQSLNIQSYDVYEIGINALEITVDHGYESVERTDRECIDIIDGSEEEGRSFMYILTQEFGQYMIPKGKYHIDYGRHNLTRNEWLTRTENPSFKTSVMDVFKTEEDVRDYIQQNDIFIKTSVIDLSEEEN